MRALESTAWVRVTEESEIIQLWRSNGLEKREIWEKWKWRGWA